jgi:Na+-transporting NADH:ubiquinone oxidoreductase subunit NqrD
MEGQSMSPQQRTLLLIAVFVALIIGSFIWFIATWDPAQEQPVSTIIELDEVRQA